MKKILLFAVISVLIVSISVTSISAQSQSDIPAWVKGVADFWVKGNISDSEFGESISFLIEQDIIHVEMANPDNSILQKKVNKLETKILNLEAENKELNDILDDLLGTNSYETDSYPDYSNYLDNGCHKDTPHLWSDGYCHNTTEPNCPTGKPHMWSNGFCYSSPEYLDNGCHSDYPYAWSDGYCYTIPESNYTPPTYEETQPSCDPSYPDVCIAPYPPDLDCDEIYYSNFRVTGSDPHGFDTDYDGIGCEVGSPSDSNPVETTPSCDPSYPDVCIAPYPPDLNCGDIGYSNFRVIGDDPHGFDRDNDGIGCES